MIKRLLGAVMVMGAVAGGMSGPAAAEPMRGRAVEQPQVGHAQVRPVQLQQARVENRHHARHVRHHNRYYHRF